MTQHHLAFFYLFPIHGERGSSSGQRPVESFLLTNFVGRAVFDPLWNDNLENNFITRKSVFTFASSFRHPE